MNAIRIWCWERTIGRWICLVERIYQLNVFKFKASRSARCRDTVEYRPSVLDTFRRTAWIVAILKLGRNNTSRRIHSKFGFRCNSCVRHDGPILAYWEEPLFRVCATNDERKWSIWLGVSSAVFYDVMVILFWIHDLCNLHILFAGLDEL